MIKKYLFRGFDLSQSLILKRIGLLVLMLYVAFTPLRAEEPRQLQLTLGDGTVCGITLTGEVVMTPIEDGVLEVKSADGMREFPLDDIKRFQLTGGSSVDGLLVDNSSQWRIFTINGTLVQSGEGTPDFSSLTSGEIYIVNQGPLSYKFLAR